MTKKINRDHAQKKDHPLMENDAIVSHLSELLTPSIFAQEGLFHNLGMRNRILNLSLMTALRSANLENAKFIRANLGGTESNIYTKINENTDFSFARLRGTNISLSELKKAILVGTEMPDGTINNQEIQDSKNHDNLA